MTRIKQVTALAVLIAAVAAVWSGGTQAATTPVAPKCTGAQQFIGNSPPNSVQIFFSCNQTIQSFKVDATKSLGSTPAGGQVENNGASQPPPEGFNCTPNSKFPKSFTCGGSATSPHTVRVTENFSSNACPDLNQTVTVGTGMPTESGNPTGATAAFNVGALRGCAAPPAKAQKCKKGYVRRHGKCVKKHKRKHCKKGYVRRHGKCVKRRHH